MNEICVKCNSENVVKTVVVNIDNKPTGEVLLHCKACGEYYKLVKVGA